MRCRLSVGKIPRLMAEGRECLVYIHCAFGPSPGKLCSLFVACMNFRVSHVLSLSTSRYDVESASLPSLFLRMLLESVPPMNSNESGRKWRCVC